MLKHTHTNSQGERIALEERKMKGGRRVLCLVIYDDPWPNGSGQPAPMLLDTGTREWLLNELKTTQIEVQT